MIIFCDRLVPKGFNAYGQGPVIFMREEFRNNEGAIAHEKVHLRQFWRAPVIHPIRYMLDARYRLKCEVEAYREMLKYYPDKLDEMANLLTKYGTGVSLESVRAMLTGQGG